MSLVITFASLLLPVFGDGYVLMLLSFSLLGIGNALMQTSLNPLLSNIVSGERLASSLTFGQFVKAIASFLAPYIAMWGRTQAIPSLGMGWRVLFPVYMVIAVIAILWLSGTSIREEAATPFHLRGSASPCWASRLSFSASWASCAMWALM